MSLCWMYCIFTNSTPQWLLHSFIQFSISSSLPSGAGSMKFTFRVMYPGPLFDHLTLLKRTKYWPCGSEIKPHCLNEKILRRNCHDRFGSPPPKNGPLVLIFHKICTPQNKKIADLLVCFWTPPLECLGLMTQLSKKNISYSTVHRNTFYSGGFKGVRRVQMNLPLGWT